MKKVIDIRSKFIEIWAATHAIVIVAFFMLAVFPGTGVHAAEGDFAWARGMGGPDSEEGIGIAVDGFGNVYTTGEFKGTADFNPGSGILSLQSAGDGDIFVSKLSHHGSFVWSFRIGGPGGDSGLGIAVDPMGNVYITGYFSGTVDFDPNESSTRNLIAPDGAAAFVAKYDGGGNLIWARRIGDTGRSQSNGIVVDASGAAHVVGSFSENLGFESNLGIPDLEAGDGYGAFVCKLDDDGEIAWASAMIGENSIRPAAIALDSTGSVLTTGQFWGLTHFNPDPTSVPVFPVETPDIFVAKHDRNGDFLWAKQFHGYGYDLAYDIAVDSSDAVYSTGSFSETLDVDPGPGELELIANGSDTYMSKLDSDGGFAWAVRMGDYNSPSIWGIAIDESDNIFATGFFDYVYDFDPGDGVFELEAEGPFDVFISKFDSSGSFDWAWSTLGTQDDIGRDIALDSTGNIYVTGHFAGSTDFDPGIETAYLEADQWDVFVLKLFGPLDSKAPEFFNVVALPTEASAGEIVSIEFESSEAITGDPVVKINGRAASRSSKALYLYTYTILPSDPFGPATIEISGADLAGNPGSLTDTSALNIVQAMPVAPLPLFALLGIAMMCVHRRRARK